jgi:hypothetical protein
VGESGAGGKDVRDGILRTHFVKTDRFRRHPVDAPLGDRNPPKDGEGALLDFRGESTRPDEGSDFGMGAPVVVPAIMRGVGMGVVVPMPMSVVVPMPMSVVVVLVSGVVVLVSVVVVLVSVVVVLVSVVVMSGHPPLASVVSRNPEPPSGDATPLTPFEAAWGEGDRKGGEGFLKNLLRDTQITKCRNGHVAADAGEGVDVQDFHRRERSSSKAFKDRPPRQSRSEDFGVRKTGSR